MLATKKQIEPPSPLLNIAFLIFLAFWILAIAVVYRNGFIKELNHPFNTPFPHPVTRFGDFFGPYTVYVLNHGVSAGISYFPSMFLILEILHNINTDPWSVLPFYIYIWPLFSFVFILIKVKKHSYGVLAGIICAVMITLSYPSLFAIHTGNFEGLVACLLLLGTYAAFTNNWKLFGLAIGAAGSMKGLPIGFLLLPIVIGTVKDFITATKVALMSVVVLTATPLVFLKNGFLAGGFPAVKNSFTAMRESLNSYNELMVNSEAGINYGHSFLNSAHAIFGMNFMPSQAWSTKVMAFFIMIGFISAFFLKRYEAPSWLVLGLIGAIGCIAPATSTDYKLLYFAPSIFMFTLAGEKRILSLLPIALIIAIMSSKPWLNVGTNAWANASVYLTTFLMMILIPISILCARIWSKSTQSTEAAADSPNSKQDPDLLN